MWIICSVTLPLPRYKLLSKPTDFLMKKQIIMFIELIADKGRYETFWGIPSFLYSPFHQHAWIFFFIYLQNVSQEMRATTLTTAITNHWRTGCWVPGWATSMGHMNDATEESLVTTFHS